MTGTSFHAYVGCRTTRERNARGDGLEVFRVDADGNWTHLQRLAGLVNPSFLCFGPGERVLYAVHGDGSDVSSHTVDPVTGLLSPLDRVSAEGRNPVHLVVGEGGRHLLVANHLTSAIAVLPLEADGRFADGPALHPVTGEPGPHRKEQPFAKPHGVTFDPSGRWLIVPDKGVDRVFVFRFDPAKGALEPAGAAVAREGAGPRHVAMHPSGRFVFCLNELDSTLTAHRLDPATGALTPFQVIPSTPDTHTGDSRAAEVAMAADGRFLYASNRGHDSVGGFAVDGVTGRLSPVGWVPSGGRTPRFIGLDPEDRFLYAANEDDDTILRLRVDAGTGALHDPALVARTGSPTCILFRRIGPR